MPQSPTANCYSLNTPNISIHIYLVYTTTLSFLYRHYHHAVSFCQLLLNKDTQCQYTLIFNILNYPLLPLPQIPRHSLLLPTATQQTHPIIVYIYILIYTTTLSFLYRHYHHAVSFCQLLLNKDTQCQYTLIFNILNYPLLPLPQIPRHSLLLPTATQKTHPIIVYIYI